jgi:intracellular sulfur oxidation DsrE/DsrF family protein
MGPGGRIALLFFSILLSPGLQSQEQPGPETRYIADIELQTLDQFQQLLARADELFLSGRASSGGDAAVVFVLHGPVLRSLLRENYPENRSTVDLAARLSAFGVIDLKACRAWMRGAGVAEADLQPFVETVSYGPDEVQRLVRENNYIYF